MHDIYDIIFKVLPFMLLAMFLLVLRLLWHGGTAWKLANQVDMREHELKLLKLQIELEKQRHDDPDSDGDFGGWSDGGEVDGAPDAEATPAA